MKKMLFWVAMATTLMTSCTKNESIESTRNEAIGFGTYVGLSAKGADADIDTLKVSGFTVNGYYTETNWETNGAAATPSIMHQTAISHSSTAWTYTPLAYWPASGTVTFFANSTHDAVTNPSVKTVVGAPYFTFTAVDTAENQIDCLAAVALDKDKQDGNVIFAFNHILSKIGFTATLSTAPTNTVVQVTGLKVNYATDKVENSGTYTHKTDGTVGSWETTGTSHGGSAGDVIKTDGVTLDATNLAPAQLNADNKFLMIVPQTLKAAGDMSVDITYTVQVGENTVLTYIKTAKIPAMEFKLKTSYVFDIKIDLNGDAITFGNPTVEDWDDATNLDDIVIPEVAPVP